MKSRTMFLRAVFASALLGLAAQAHAVTEIQWWHAMTGANNDRVNALAKKFSDSQSEYKVTAVYKGSYPEAMAAAIAAYRAGNAPALLQVFEVGTGTMMAAKEAIKPVFEVMSEVRREIRSQDLCPGGRGLLHGLEGADAVLPVQQLDDGVLVQQGRVREGRARPQPRAADLARGRCRDGQAQGVRARLSVHHRLADLDAARELLGLAQRAVHDQGQRLLASSDAKLVFNGPVQVRHIENMQDWIKKGYFVYGGRKNEPEAKFYSGECAMMTTSSAAYGTIKQNAKFKFAESTLPYYADVAGAPQNTIIGGASLWVMGGKKKEEYKAVAKFLTFLSQPEIQAEFSQATGYLPITMAAYELTKKSGFYEKNPGTNVAVEQMIVKTTNNSRGVRAGNFPQIRDVMDEELEAVWAGKKTAKQGLDDATKRGNEIIERFNKANNG